MKCIKCGYETTNGILTCPKCGTRIESVSIPNTIEKSKEETIETTDNKSILPIILLLIILIGCGLYAYNEFYLKKDEPLEYVNNLQSNIIKYREEGYSINELDQTIYDLDPFILVNNKISYLETKTLDEKDLVCSISNKVTFVIDQDKLIIKDINSNYYKIVEQINDVKYIANYKKDNCECNDYVIVVLTKDGEIYYYENIKEKLSNKEFIDKVSNGFTKLDLPNRIKSFAVTSYVGEINPCGEKVLLLLDDENTQVYYKDGRLNDIEANYSQIIYNIASGEEKNYSLFINPDRTMQIGTDFDDNNKYITDSNANKIKYYGIFKEENSLELNILATNKKFYVLNLSNSLTASQIRSLDVAALAYKFDLETMKNKYIVIYSDGSTREYSGSFESHGAFSIK